MNEDFLKALKVVLNFEGGFVDNPADPGGRTNKGITQGVYNKYMLNKGIGKADVKGISDKEVEEIYFNSYWKSCHAEETGCYESKLVLFDTAVNFGIGGCVEFIQEVLGVSVDGDYGSITKAAMMAVTDWRKFAIKICEGRIAYRYKRVKEVPSQDVFLQGWLNRDNALLKIAKPSCSVKVENGEDLKEIALRIAEDLRVQGGGGGMETSGNNSGPLVDKFLTVTGVPVGSAWCASFIFYVINEACKKIGERNIYIKSGYCPAIDEWAKEKGILSDKAQRGDIALLCDSISAFHIGFVTGVNGDNTVNTIEGNTNGEGSDEGDGIYLKKRYVDCNKYFLKFVKWHKLFNTKELKVINKDKQICSARVIGGKAYVPARAFCKAFNVKVEWIDGKLRVKGKVIESVMVEESAYCYIREIAEILGVSIVQVDREKIIVLES